jgi:hypothetical protein
MNRDIDKVKIYQGGYDGFGHQFEGTLRLLSLSINKKAQYVYDYNKEFSFDHNPRDSDILMNYILEGLIFSITVIFILLNNYLIYNGIKVHSSYTKIFLIGTSILAIIGMIGLIISRTIFKNISEIFPSFENLMLLNQGFSVFALGFM